MKKVISVIFATLLMLSLVQCDKYLDLDPSQDISENIALSTDENVRHVLTGAYSEFALPGIYGGNLLRNAELLGGDGELQWLGTNIDPRQIFNKTMTASNSDAEAQWEDSYKVINSVNNVLSALPVVNESSRDRIQGEALFLRSLVYFDLVRFFADQYKAGVPNIQPGVPLLLTQTHGLKGEINVSRNTVDEVYNQIISDLTLAASKLPVNNGPYATNGAANALLARVYLQRGDYTLARDVANIVISSGRYSIVPAYASEFNNDGNTVEDIFATQITPQDRFSAMTEFFSVPEFGGRSGDIEIVDGHLNLYTVGDQRLNLFFVADGAVRSGKWNNKFGVVNLIRLAEMYLIRAECNLRLSASIGAAPLDDYNIIHTRAGLPAANAVTIDGILLERRLELSFEGFKIHDMRRLHLNVGALPYNDPKLLFPIPAREIEANPALKTQQNPSY